MNTISKSNGIFTLNVQIYFADRSYNKMQRYGSFLSAYKQNFADRSYKKQRIFVGTVHIYRFIPSFPIPFD